jgi:hypothetical protein
LIAQGVYYLVSGVWPLVHRRSFEAVTGRRTDFCISRIHLVDALIEAGLVGALASVHAGNEHCSDAATAAACG